MLSRRVNNQYRILKRKSPITNNHTVLFLSNVLGQALQVTFVTVTGILLIQMHISNVLKLSCITTFQVNPKYFESIRVLNDSHSSFTSLLTYSFLIHFPLPKCIFLNFCFGNQMQFGVFCPLGSLLWPSHYFVQKYKMATNHPVVWVTARCLDKTVKFPAYLKDVSKSI